mmetsp:Transcript_81843/g.162945  ORF Transcript_81843/g.162945 Transcript_81843/m.162945 type:complete len:138 (-) Transcript_81843:81-494(-)
MITSFQCRPEGSLPPAIDQVDSLLYMATMSSPHACANNSPLVPILVASGGGTLFVLLLLVAVACFVTRKRRAPSSNAGTTSVADATTTAACWCCWSAKAANRQTDREHRAKLEASGAQSDADLRAEVGLARVRVEPR